MISLSEEYKKRLKKLSGLLFEDEVSSWADDVQKELGLKAFDLWINNRGDIKLQSLIVPKDIQRQGLGSEAMKRLIDYADKLGKRIILTPGVTDKNHGTTSRARLVNFYKQFGFIENKGRYKDFTLSDGMYREPKKKSLPESTSEIDTSIMYFLRNTDNPQKDLERGFSCNVNTWFDSKQEADEYQSKHGALSEPKLDKHSGKWCADPELGLSAFAFNDEKTFIEAINRISQYSVKETIALFSSTDYMLNVGLDGEDVFKNGKFLKMINIHSKYHIIF